MGNLKLIQIGEFRCVIQSYLENDFVNISPALTDNQSKKYPFGIGNIRIIFGKPNKFGTDGKECEKWKETISLIGSDIEQKVRIVLGLDTTHKQESQLLLF